MDYSNLSDFEINKRVALALGYRLYKDGSSCQKNHVSVEDYGKCGAIAMEWCNNPSDAWPIIVENRLYIDPIYVSDWSASSGCDSFREIHKNPLRAAMIVFLMMQESANVPANSTGSDIR